MNDPFLIGLAVGGVLGAAGIAALLVRLAALATIAAGAWLLTTHGLEGAQSLLLQAVDSGGGGYGLGGLGVLVGALLGTALLRGLNQKNW
jgi:hypothetical protein